MLYETKFLVSLFLTILLELPVVFLFLRYVFKIKNLSTYKILFVGSLASALTLPYLWFVLPPFIKSNYYVLLSETFAILIEALIYNQLLKLRIDKSLMLSITANLFSFLIGLLIL